MAANTEFRDLPAKKNGARNTDQKPVGTPIRSDTGTVEKIIGNKGLTGCPDPALSAPACIAATIRGLPVSGALVWKESPRKGQSRPNRWQSSKQPRVRPL